MKTGFNGLGLGLPNLKMTQIGHLDCKGADTLENGRSGAAAL